MSCGANPCACLGLRLPLVLRSLPPLVRACACRLPPAACGSATCYLLPVMVAAAAAAKTEVSVSATYCLALLTAKGLPCRDGFKCCFRSRNCSWVNIFTNCCCC